MGRKQAENQMSARKDLLGIHCSSCYRSLINNRMHGIMATRARGVPKSICFIGAAPSTLDIKIGEPFTGRNNILLRQAITLYKLDEWSYLTYLVKCYGTDNEKLYIKNCIHYLIEEIKAINPLIIVPLGSTVLKALTENNNIIMKNEVNKPRAYANTIMIPIYDCAYINKNKCYEEYDKSFAIISDILAKRDIKYKEWKHEDLEK
jgi:uracil-DNA glycosylase family 4